MSSSPIEPEYAASTGSVRPGQGHKKSGEVNILPKTPWTPPPRTKSTSLLTQALATTYEVDESPSETASNSHFPVDHSPTQSSKLQIDTPAAHSQHYNGVKIGEGSVDEMAMVASMTVGNMRASLAFGERPTTSSSNGKYDFASMLGHHRDFLGTTKIRGTSLERTAKEKRVQHLSGSFQSNNPGDTGMIGERPSQRPTSPESISSNPPTHGMRAQYRSWRDVNHGIAAERTWSIDGNGRDSGHGGQVEKSIGEALAGVEPSNRSRKASHSLGLFKEGHSGDKSNSRDSSNASRFRDASTNSRALSAIRNSTLQHGPESPGTSKDGEGLSWPDWRSPSNSPFKDDGISSKQNIDGAMNLSAGITPKAGYFDISHNIETVTNDQIRQLPPSLLADIRKHHNLTPGAAKGSSFSGSIPVPASEKLQNSLEEDEDHKPADEDDFYDGPGLAHVKSTDEGNDSGEEQVFRALFVPHQSTHQASDCVGHGEETGATLPAAKPSLEAKSHQWLEEHKVALDEEVSETPEDELLSSRRLPVELQKEPPPHDDQLGEAHPGQTNGARPLDSAIGVKESSNEHSQYVHDHQLEMTEPLFAIELKPYRHQVGGHTTMWKFSKRAVCKLLNNRENEFYERIEHYHPQLLDFMPRYIGVLNVTFRKERRRSHRNGDSGLINIGHEPNQSDSKDSPGSPTNVEASTNRDIHSATEAASSPVRLISQSLASATHPIPTVTFEDNRHIIPSNFLIPRPQSAEFHNRAHSDSTASSTSRISNGSLVPNSRTLSDRPTTTQNPWGKTHVNKQLRNEVFKDAFLAPIPIQPHKKPASNLRPLPNRSGASLRPSNSESSLKVAHQNQSAASTQEDSIRKKAMKTAAEQAHASVGQTNHSHENGNDEHDQAQADADADADATESAEFDGKAGTSAPESEVARAEGTSSSRRQRRYSSGGLRRKPNEGAEGRGDLKYFVEADEAGYKGDVEDDVFPMDFEPAKICSSYASGSEAGTHSNAEYSSTGPVSPITEQVTPPGTMNMDLPRPVNPKEARARPDSRSEYFLLLEDLTCNMKRPCVMDLKMGTRQYGVEANEKKQKSQRRKCAETTSKELGVRVCGVQVWDVTKQDYVFQDKYSGRNLKVGEEFQEALTRFLYNGVDHSSVLRHIPTILEELSQLDVIVKGLAGYRFYAASLLMIYDGDIEDPQTTDAVKREALFQGRNITVRVADFANCITKEDFLPEERPCPPRHPDLPDNGFLRGLRSLRRYFMKIQRDVCLEIGVDSRELLTGHNESTLGGMDDDDDGVVSY